jgi:ABC-2 type transport system ATP-binding protein
MIEVRGLSKKYGDRSAIQNLSFSIRKGEVVGFLGPNGAGKSTTMKIITGYMAPTDGQVSIAGYDVFENPIEVKRRIGYLPETPPLYPDMFVNDYLLFVARLKGVERSRQTSLINAALEKTALTEVRSRLIGNLSKGFKQRVGLAQALVSDPEVLVLDEPTVGLDPKQMVEVRHLIQQLKGQHTIILSTHILPEVQAVCEKVIIINKGEIVAEDSLNGLSRRMTGGGRMTIRVRRLAEPTSQAISQVSGVTGVRHSGLILEVEYDGNENTVEQVAQKIVQTGAGLTELKVESMGLEDIFIKLTTLPGGG